MTASFVVAASEPSMWWLTLIVKHWQEAGLPENFQIMDSDDQYRTIRRLIRGLGIDEGHYPPREVQWFINGQKDESLRPQHIEDNSDYFSLSAIQFSQDSQNVSETQSYRYHTLRV